MKNISSVLTASSLALVSAQVLAGQVPVRLAGTGTTAGTFGGGVAGTAILNADEGTYDTTSGVLEFLFEQINVNILPTYSAGVLSNDGKVIIGTPGGGDGLFDPTPYGTNEAVACAVVSGFNSCSYVGIGTGLKDFDDLGIILDPDTPDFVFGTLENSLPDTGNGEQTQGFHVNYDTVLTDDLTDTEVRSRWTMVSVPAPESQWLLGSALMGLVAVRRKRYTLQ